MKECNHLNKSTTVDMKTGKETKSNGKMFMLPPAKDKCQECATDHKPDQPHNAQSLFYQYKFYDENGRWPNWKDAMRHCSAQTQVQWTMHLEMAGVDVTGGKVNPEKKDKKK